MAAVHIYFGIENLNLTNAQRAELVSALHALGAANDSIQPAERNHWRIRPDNDAVIFEALFDESAISIDAVKAYLGTIFSVDPATIDNANQQTQVGRMVTFSRAATDYLRMIAFGYDGGWPSWKDSGDAARQYLAANAVEWGEA